MASSVAKRMEEAERGRHEQVIVGGGLAGMVAALELLQQGRSVMVIDSQPRELAGGLARYAFGGMALVGTQEQRWMRVPDSPSLMLSDWLSFGELADDDVWPRRWAEHYVEHCRADVYDWVKSLGLRFLPAVNWVERGLYTPGNSVPRYHVLWGTGQGLVEALLLQLYSHERDGRLQWLSETRVQSLQREGDSWVLGLQPVAADDSTLRYLRAQIVMVAAGGFTGNLQRVRQEWPGAPAEMLNGSHPDCNGVMHDAVAAAGGVLSHMDCMWNYAAGIAHPQPQFPGQGLSLLPPKSALWLNHRGDRIGPEPLVTGFDTPWLCQRVSEQEKPWTWQLLNWRIAARELSVSGAEHNPHVRDRHFLRFARDILLGNHALVRQLAEQCEDVLVADTLEELVARMNALTGIRDVDAGRLALVVGQYDQQIRRGRVFRDDDQLRRIEQLRKWRTERLRTCVPRPLLDPSSGPLVALRLRLITRKSLGGICTDLDSRVLGLQGQPLPGLYAIGEVAGFGGGGSSGRRSLEGTFLSGCILTAKQAARAVLKEVR